MDPPSVRAAIPVGVKNGEGLRLSVDTRDKLGGFLFLFCRLRRCGRWKLFALQCVHAGRNCFQLGHDLGHECAVSGSSICNIGECRFDGACSAFMLLSETLFDTPKEVGLALRSSIRSKFASRYLICQSV